MLCKPHKATGERPIAEAKSLTVEQDLNAIDSLHFEEARDIDCYGDYHIKCENCKKDVTFARCACTKGKLVTPPLTHKPFAKVA